MGYSTNPLLSARLDLMVCICLLWPIFSNKTHPQSLNQLRLNALRIDILSKMKLIRLKKWETKLGSHSYRLWSFGEASKKYWMFEWIVHAFDQIMRRRRRNEAEGKDGAWNVMIICQYYTLCCDGSIRTDKRIVPDRYQMCPKRVKVCTVYFQCAAWIRLSLHSMQTMRTPWWALHGRCLFYRQLRYFNLVYSRFVNFRSLSHIPLDCNTHIKIK